MTERERLAGDDDGFRVVRDGHDEWIAVDLSGCHSSDEVWRRVLDAKRLYSARASASPPPRRRWLWWALLAVVVLGVVAALVMGGAVTR